MGARWHNLVNTTEPSVCGDDAAFLGFAGIDAP